MALQADLCGGDSATELSALESGLLEVILKLIALCGARACMRACPTPNNAVHSSCGTIARPARSKHGLSLVGVNLLLSIAVSLSQVLNVAM